MMLKKLSETAGIMAVAIKRGDETPEFAGEERWRPILDQSLRVSQVAGDVDLRITLAASTITVNTEKGFTVAVVIPLGHPVQKSLLRLIRRQRVRAEQKIDLGQLQSWIPELPDLLTPIEADIIRSRFGLDGDELPFRALGHRHQLSRERIRQLQEQALDKLGRELRRRGLHTEMMVCGEP